MKWCRPSGDVILASSWQGTDVALKQIPTPGEASGDVEPAVMALLLRKQNAPSCGRTLGLRSQGTEGLPRKSVRAQKKTRNCASLCVLGSIKAPIIPCRVEGRKTNQPPHSEARRKGRAFRAHFSPRPLKCKQLTALEPYAEKPREAAQRRKKAVYGSHSSTVQTGAKPGLADVPPGQLQRFILRLPPLDLLSPFSSRFSDAYIWLAVSNSGFSITP